MALFHFHVTQVKRSAGQSIVTSAAYRAGEKLYSEYYGEVSDYTHKGGDSAGDRHAGVVGHRLSFHRSSKFAQRGRQNGGHVG